MISATEIANLGSAYAAYEDRGYEAIDMVDLGQPTGRGQMDQTLSEATLWFGPRHIIAVRAPEKTAAELGYTPSPTLWAVMVHEAGARIRLEQRARAERAAA